MKQWILEVNKSKELRKESNKGQNIGQEGKEIQTQLSGAVNKHLLNLEYRAYSI